MPDRIIGLVFAVFVYRNKYSVIGEAGAGVREMQGAEGQLTSN